MAEAATAMVARSAGKQTLVKKVISQATKLKRIADESTRITETVMEVAIAGGTAIGWGVVVAKFPQVAKIPGTEIDTGLIAGIALVGISMFSKSKMGGAMQSAGLGLLLPWLFQKGQEIGAGL